MSNNDVIVVGYPRSGNTYTARLLGDLLDSPVTGWGTAHPIAEEGLDRKGRYVVRQLHLRPNFEIKDGQAIHDAWTFAVNQWDGEKIIYIIRDPRDVCVSAMHYWGMPDLEIAIENMAFGKGPLQGVGSWLNFTEQWNKVTRDNSFLGMVWQTRYELLTNQPISELANLIYSINHLPVPDNDEINKVIQRQSFDVRKKELASSGSKYMYGAEVQVKNLRKGIVGDWKNHFNRKNAEVFEKHFGVWMRYYKYTSSPDWWKEIA